MNRWFTGLFSRLFGHGRSAPQLASPESPPAETGPYCTPESVAPSIGRWLQTSGAKEITRAFTLMQVSGEELLPFLADYELRLRPDAAPPPSGEWWRAVTAAYAAEPLVRACVAEALVRRGLTLEGFAPALAAQQPFDFELCLAVVDAGHRPPPIFSAGISLTGGWTDEEVREQVEHVKRRLDWDNATGSARKWWEAFEGENKDRASLVLRLAEELAVKKATITEFFLAYVYSNTDNIQANIHYLDYTRLKKEESAARADEARSAGTPPALVAPTWSSPLPPGVTDTRGWPEDRIREKLDEVKRQLDWDNTTGSARKWWEDFEAGNAARLELVMRLAEELAVRKATITEFFLAHVYSITDNIQANIHYLDYTRLKKEEERKKKAAADKTEGTRQEED